MQCEICGKKTLINHGDANHVFCQDCSDAEEAREIIKNREKIGKKFLRPERSDIGEYLTQNIESLIVGVGVLFVGLLLGIILMNLFHAGLEFLLVFAVFFLSGVMMICTLLVVSEFRTRKPAFHEATEKVKEAIA